MSMSSGQQEDVLPLSISARLERDLLLRESAKPTISPEMIHRKVQINRIVLQIRWLGENGIEPRTVEFLNERRID